MPILILTARDATEEKVHNFEAGADDYLTKPFAFAELIMRVKALLRRGPVTRSSVLRVADLEVDRLSQQVRRAGKRIELTRQGVRAAGVPRRQSGPGVLADHDHRARLGPELRGLTNIVDVYVRHLRSKVDHPYPQKTDPHRARRRLQAGRRRSNELTQSNSVAAP